MQELLMPKLGNTVESVIIAEWHKNLGDDIAAGDIICEVETDKSTMEVEAEFPGVLLAKLFEVNDEVTVLTPFAIVGEPGDDVSKYDTQIPESGGAESGVKPLSGESEAPLPGKPSQKEGIPTVPVGILGNKSEKGAASPRACKLAASVKLPSLPEEGSGPGGRIIERDIRGVLDRTSLDALTIVSDTSGRETDIGDENLGPMSTMPLNGVRRLIARRMLSSLQETAQLTLNTSVSATSLLAWRRAYKGNIDEQWISKITLNDLIMYTVTRVLPRHLELNSTFVGDEIRQYRHIHLGFAVDTPRGLMVPVIKFADQLSLLELSKTARELASACRESAIAPEQLTGSTFTITNLGAFGIESFTPVLNAPEVSILGVGTIVNAPIEGEDGSLGIEKRLGLSLTIDHQVVDGAPGARFLKEFVGMLEHLELVMAV